MIDAYFESELSKHSVFQHARNGSVAVGAAGNRAIARQ
jgi:hypothetical protein